MNQKHSSKDRFSSFLMLLPAVISLAVFSIYPFLWIFRYVCYDYNGFTATYTGSKNWNHMLKDKVFWQSVRHTFEYAGLKLLFIIPLALLLAVLLNMKMKGSKVFRGIYFMPTIIATSISGMIFTFIFATKNGILNELLKTLHFIHEPVRWLSSTDYVMAAVIVLALWGGVGNYMLYFTTGINSISTDVYESAKIDGAGTFQTFFKVTLPMLSPVIKVVLMLAITSAFKDYEAIMVLTQGGPGNRSMVMFLYIYQLIFGTATASTQPQIGYAALLSVIAAIIVGAVTIVYMVISRELDHITE